MQASTGRAQDRATYRLNLIVLLILVDQRIRLVVHSARLGGRRHRGRICNHLQRRFCPLLFVSCTSRGSIGLAISIAGGEEPPHAIDHIVDVETGPVGQRMERRLSGVNRRPAAGTKDGRQTERLRVVGRSEDGGC